MLNAAACVRFRVIELVFAEVRQRILDLPRRGRTRAGAPCPPPQPPPRSLQRRRQLPPSASTVPRFSHPLSLPYWRRSGRMPLVSAAGHQGTEGRLCSRGSGTARLRREHCREHVGSLELAKRILSVQNFSYPPSPPFSLSPPSFSPDNLNSLMAPPRGSFRPSSAGALEAYRNTYSGTRCAPSQLCFGSLTAVPVQGLCCTGDPGSLEGGWRGVSM